MDFEKAAINSFQQVWPATQVKSCFFHLTQNIWRKVQAEGLQAAYNQDEELALRIRLLPALAFASPFDVLEVFGDVVQELVVPTRIPCSQLRCGYHYDTAFGLPRTTNAVEAWHRSFNATVGRHYPNIWKVITALKREQGLVEVRQAKFIAGTNPPKRRNRYRTKNHQICQFLKFLMRNDDVITE